MLLSLHVKNLAGETGAGKSLIIGSVNLALGGRADKDLIRTGADYCLVELTFSLENEKVRQAIEALDVPISEDGTLLLQRRIMPNRSVCRIGGETVSAKQLQEVASLLIDIHGQQENQTLLLPGRQRALLDAYIGAPIQGLQEKLSALYERFRVLESELAESGMDEASRRREIDLATFALKEITEASLVLGEDEILEQQYKKLSNSRRIAEAVDKAYQQSGYGEDAAGAAVGRGLKELRQVTAFDAALEDLERQLLEIDGLLNDFNRAAADYLSGLEADDGTFSQTENRLNLINDLKAKYGASIADILAYAENQQKRLDFLADLDAHREKLLAEKEEVLQEMKALCAQISALRKQGGDHLTEALLQALNDLNFMHVEFCTDISSDEEKITPEGWDQVTFMISLNQGEELKPLSHVASGGELSRIMLAFKTVLADKDDTETLIFDEIDAGISGPTAWKVAEKMGLLGHRRQVICITHLPQIAAMADVHFLIEKSLADGRTHTTLQCLNAEESIRELARMLGGASVTDAVLENAREMKALAEQSKK